ncbi:MAG: PGF-pre-PGF domain-containing protein [Nanoarchaeota archaeon]|nr:PGF-pre-PGF domain-containing protein [Nanoarchaeota archaeon]
MAKNFRLFGILLLALVTLSVANADWTMFGGNVNRTFAAGDVADIVNLALLWDYSVSCEQAFGSVQLMTPVVVDNINGNTVAVFNSNCGDGKVFALNLDDKSKLWEFNLPNYSMSQPVYYNGIVIIGNDLGNVYDDNWNLIASYPSHLYAINVTDGSLVWQKDFDKSIDTSPLVVDGVLYFGLNGANSPFLVLNTTTGENLTDGHIVYNGNKVYFPGSVMSPFALLGDNIVAGVTDSNWGNSGWLYLINKSGYAVKNVTVDGYVKAAPAIYNNTIFLGTGSGLRVYDSNLNLLASYNTEPIQMGVNVNDYDGDGKPEIVFGVGDYFTNSEKKVYVLEFNGTGLASEKTFDAKSYVASVPLVMDINNDGNLEVVFEDRSNSTYVYNYTSGELIKEIEGVHGTAAPVFYNVSGKESVLLAGDDSFFVFSNHPYNFLVGDIVVNDSSPREYSLVGINISIKNDGFEEGNATVRLYNGSNLVDEEDVINVWHDIVNVTFEIAVDRNTNLTVKIEAVEQTDYNLSNNEKQVSITVRYCGDGICSPWENCDSCSEDCSCSSDNGGSSGSSGGTTNTSFSSDYVNTLFNPGKHVEINITYGKIDLEKVEINLKNNLSRIVFKVSKVDNPNVSFSGKVYQYIKIDVEGATDSDIEGANITFKVNGTWLDENNISYNEVALFRYHNGDWQELKTQLTNHKDGVYYFTAFSPGFSYFAIGVKNETTVKNETNTTSVVSETSSVESSSVEKGGNSNPWIWIGISIVILFVAAFLFFRPKIPKGGKANIATEEEIDDIFRRVV